MIGSVLTPSPRIDEHSERCDRCPALALVSLELEAATLAMCGHHYNEHWIALAAAGWEVTRDARSA